VEVEGTVEKGYEPLRAALAEGQASDEGGAQLCVYRHGKKVVDLWTGMDKANGRPFTADTIAVLMSCTKAATALCAHILAERGLIEFDAPVIRYWPEFGTKGKSRITVRDLLSHRAGLMGFDPDAGLSPEDVFRPDRTATALANMEPLWSPGTASYYHFTTFGDLVGEVIRRVSGMSVGRFLAANVSGPLDIDLWIGLPEEQEHRFAPFIPPAHYLNEEQWRVLFAGLGIDLIARLPRTVMNTFLFTEKAIPMMNTRAGRAAELPAGNGIGNARALAKMYAACIGEVDGVRLINESTMERARRFQNEGLSVPAEMAPMSGGDPQQFALGFELPRRAEPMLGPGSFGHAGAGGRMAFAHPESGTAVAYVCTSMLWDGVKGPDDRWVPWTKALRGAIGL
jgi:CubicO group peptidase (beta-lactamase class C family)